MCRVTKRDRVKMRVSTTGVPMTARIRKIYKVLKLRPLCLTYRKAVIVVTPTRRTRGVMRALRRYPCSRGTTVVKAVARRGPNGIVHVARVKARSLLPRPNKRLLPEVYWADSRVQEGLSLRTLRTDLRGRRRAAFSV